MCLHRNYKFPPVKRHPYSTCSTPSNNQTWRQVRWSCILGLWGVEPSIPSSCKQSLQAILKTFDIGSVLYLLAQHLQVRLVRTQVWSTQFSYSCDHTSTHITVFIWIYNCHKHIGAIPSLPWHAFMACTRKILSFTNTLLRDLNKGRHKLRSPHNLLLITNQIVAQSFVRQQYTYNSLAHTFTWYLGLLVNNIHN